MNSLRQTIELVLDPSAGEWWRCERPFEGPPNSKSTAKRINRESCSRGPISETQSNAVVSQKMVIPFISRLLKAGGPLHVHCPPISDALFTFAARIVSVYILSVQRVLGGRRRSHVGVKGLEVRPPLANNDPPATVVLKSTSIRTSAPRHHRHPAPVFTAVGHAMDGFCGTCSAPAASELAASTAARFHEGMPSSFDKASAVATAAPDSTGVLAALSNAREFNYLQKTEPLPDHILRANARGTAAASILFDKATSTHHLNSPAVALAKPPQSTHGFGYMTGLVDPLHNNKSAKSPSHEVVWFAPCASATFASSANKCHRLDWPRSATYATTGPAHIATRIAPSQLKCSPSTINRTGCNRVDFSHFSFLRKYPSIARRINSATDRPVRADSLDKSAICFSVK